MTDGPTPPDFNLNQVFQEELAKAYRDEQADTTFPADDWFTAGRGKGESREWWEANGERLVQNFVTWYEASPEFKVWSTPDNIPAIELPFNVKFGNVPVKGFIDLILVHQPTGTLIVTDIKSGSTRPKNSRQLGVYASAVQRMYGVRPRYGTFFMCRGTGKDDVKLFFQQPVELDGPEHSYQYLTGEFERLEQGIQSGVFPASPGDNCRKCGVAYACLEAHGERARELDPNWPEGK